MRVGTKLIHTGYESDKQTGALSVPVHHASTYHQEDFDRALAPSGQ